MAGPLDDPTNESQSPLASLNDGIDTAVTAAPNLAKAPGAVLDAAKMGGNVASTARSLDQAQIRKSLALSANQVNTQSKGGLWGVLSSGLGDIHKAAHYANEGTGGLIGDPLGWLTKAANAPLRAVQHEWRYLHDVQARHGTLAAVLEGLGIAGVVAAGVVLTGGVADIDMAGFGATLGDSLGEGEAGEAGEAGIERTVGNALKGGFKKFMGVNGGRAAAFNLPVSQALGQVMFRDSWNRTASGTYVDPHTGQPVSFGRDIASGFLNLKPGSGTYASLSGALDAAADLMGDPLQGALADVGKARSVEGASGVLADAGFTGHAMRLDNFEWKANPASGIAGQDTRRLLAFLGDPDVGGAQIAREYPQLEPYAFDHQIAAEPDQQAMLADTYGKLAKARDDWKFYNRLSKEGTAIEATHGPLEENLEQLGANRLRELAEATRDRPYLRKGNLGMLENIKQNTIPHLEEQIEELIAKRDGIPKVTLKGFGSAKTPDEAADVFRRRIFAPGEAIGHRLPSRSIVKESFSKVRDFVGNSENPLLRKAHRATSLEPGLLDVERDQRVASIGLASFKRMGNLVRWLSPDIGQDAAYSIVNAMEDMDLPGRQRALQQAFLMKMYGRAGLTLDATMEPAEAMEKALAEIKNPKLATEVKAMFDNLFQPANPEATDFYETTLSGLPPQPLMLPSGTLRAAAGRLSQAQDEVRLPTFYEMRRASRALANGRDWLGGVDEFLARDYTQFFKPVALFSVGYPARMGLSELLLFANKEGFLKTGKAIFESAATSLGYKVENSDEALDGVAEFMHRVLPSGAKNSAEAKEAMQLYILSEGNGVSRANSTAGFLLDQDLGEGLTARKAMRHSLLVHGKNYEMKGDLSGPVDKYGNIVRDSLGDPMSVTDPAKRSELRSHLRQMSKSAPHQAAARVMLGAKDTESVRGEAEAAFKAELNKLPADQLESMDRAKYKVQGSPRSLTPLDDWSKQSVENLYALTHRAPRAAPSAAEGFQKGDIDNALGVPKARPHAQTRYFLRSVANGITPSEKSIASLDDGDLPISVPGREIIEKPAGLFERVADRFFAKIVTPVVQTLARRPMTLVMYRKGLRVYQPMVDKGLMTEEAASVRAYTDAQIENIRYMHNPEDRVGGDRMLRNALPFFFAQEQAYRRAGRLLWENPAAFRRYQLEIMGVANVITNMNSASGQAYVGIPGSGFVSDVMSRGLGIIVPLTSIHPDGLGGTVSSLQVVFPTSNGLRPDESPLVVFPAKGLADIFANDAKDYKDFAIPTKVVEGLTEAAIGPEAENESMLSSIIPNSDMARAAKAFGLGTSLNNAQVLTIANLAYQQQVAVDKWNADGQKGPEPQIVPGGNASPTQVNDFLARVRNQSVVMMLLSSAFGFISPVGSDVTTKDYGLPESLDADLTKYGVTKGYQIWSAKNPDALSYEVAHSTTTDNIPLKESNDAMGWVQDNLKSIESNPSLLYLMPSQESSNYNYQAYYQQIADGLRTRQTPAQFLNALYGQQYATMYFAQYDRLQKDLAAAGSDKQQQSALYTAFDGYMQKQSQLNPLGYANFNNNNATNTAVSVIQGLKQAYADNTAPRTNMYEPVKDLLTNYDAALDAYTTAEKASDWSEQESAVKKAWQQYCAQVVQENPALSGIVSHVFRAAISTSPLAGK